MFLSHINSILFNLSNLYLAPATEIGSGGGMSQEDVIDFLGDDNDKKESPIDIEEKKSEKDSDDSKNVKDKKRDEEPEEDDKDTEDEEEVEEDELVELEEELKGPTEEQLELTTPVRRKEILKKYPQLFKDFPYLEKAYYREQQFTELLPTIEDAKTAVEKAEILDRFENDLINGNTEVVLRGIKTENPKAFAKVVDDYLPTLARIDEKAYHHVIGNTIKHTIVAMVREARSSDNEALQTAASILNQFVFGSSDFQPIQKLSSDNDNTELEDKVSQREKEFNERQFNTAKTDLTSRVNNSIKSTIEAHIDPKESMTDYVRKNATREAIEMVESLIEKDSRFKIIVNKLWEKSGNDDFDKLSLDRIRSAYLAKAKTLLPSVIKKARQEALKGMGKRTTEFVESVEKEIEQPRSNSFSSPKNDEKRSSGKIKSAKDIPVHMSTLDFMMQD